MDISNIKGHMDSLLHGSMFRSNWLYFVLQASLTLFILMNFPMHVDPRGGGTIIVSYLRRLWPFLEVGNFEFQ